MVCEYRPDTDLELPMGSTPVLLDAHPLCHTSIP
jgi:hypothetical protein